MEIHKRHQEQGTKPLETPVFHEPDFVLVQDHRPPPRIELARERMLMCRLYLGLIRSMTEDYGSVFAAHNDSSTFRTIGIYVFLRTVMCSPVSAGRIAHALKLPRVIVVRRLQEMVKPRSRGARRQCLSCHRQSEYSGPQKQTSAANGYDRGDGKKTVRTGQFGRACA